MDLQTPCDFKSIIGIFILVDANESIVKSNQYTLKTMSFCENYVDCSDKVLNLFLDGLIIKKRGKQDSAK